MRIFIGLIAIMLMTGCNNPFVKDDYSEYDARDVVVTSPTDWHQLGVFHLVCETRYDGDTGDAKWSRTDAVFTNTTSFNLSFNFNIYGISEATATGGTKMPSMPCRREAVPRILA
jgi:hypothetical protein